MCTVLCYAGILISLRMFNLHVVDMHFLCLVVITAICFADGLTYLIVHSVEYSLSCPTLFYNVSCKHVVCNVLNGLNVPFMCIIFVVIIFASLYLFIKLLLRKSFSLTACHNME